MRALVKAGIRMAGKPESRLWLLTGGHTAEAFFRVLGLRGCLVPGLLLPGLSLLQGIGPQGRRVWAASKPGGFGDLDLMLQFMKLKRWNP
jgi:uncharacterized protein YgbK (DUF1537 family)